MRSKKVKIPVQIEPRRDVVTQEEIHALLLRQESVEKLEVVRKISACEIASRLKKGAREESGAETFNRATGRVERKKNRSAIKTKVAS